MERVGRLLGQSKLGKDCLTPEQMAVAAWAPAVGRIIAGHARAVSLVRGRLVVETEDGLWQKQLFSLRQQIVDGIAKVIGPGIVLELEVREHPRRRMPGRAGEPERGAGEGEGIEDPVLARIYRTRKRRHGKGASA